MDAARKGIVTPQIEQVLEQENISREELLAHVAAGSVAIPANKHHSCLKTAGVGQGLKTKINVNLGVSKDVCSFEAELNKVHLAIKYQADAGDVTKGLTGSTTVDRLMSRARSNLDWEGQFMNSLDPEKAREYRNSSQPAEQEVCTMCGDFCAVKRVNNLLKTE